MTIPRYFRNARNLTTRECAVIRAYEGGCPTRRWIIYEDDAGRTIIGFYNRHAGMHEIRATHALDPT